MTLLTNDIRNSLLCEIMAGLPNTDYITQIHTVVQDTIAEFMPEEIRAVYDDPGLRPYLGHVNLYVRNGNYSLPMWKSNNPGGASVLGLTKDFSIQMDERNEGGLVEGTLYHAVYHRLKDDNLVGKYFEQEDLRQDVSRRLKANLAAATTIKRLYDVLEPELHGFIPVDVATGNLPATVAPVVDDLKKLGFGAN